MSLKSSYEAPIKSMQGLSPYIISLGSFERDGSLPYLYNNQMTGIVIQDLDSNFAVTDDNNILNSKDVKYKGINFNVPVLTNQLEYQILNTVGKNNNSKTSIIFVMEYYKQVVPMLNNLDEYGMLLYGFKYQQGSNSYDFNTIGIRGKFGTNNGQYGIFLWGEALIYSQDSGGNTTINSVSGSKTDVTFLPYDYSIENFTILCNTYSNDSSSNLYINFKDVDSNINLSLNIDTSTDSNNNYVSSKLNNVITMPNYSQNINYSLYHFKTFGDQLTIDELEAQSHLLITLQGVKYV